MPKRDWRLRVSDILDSITKIQEYVAGLTFEMFRHNEMAVDAVVRNLEIIGEAARHIPAEVEAISPDIPWNDMRAMRNIIAHEYFGIDRLVVWETAAHDLPPLIPTLEKLLNDL